MSTNYVGFNCYRMRRTALFGVLSKYTIAPIRNNL